MDSFPHLGHILNLPKYMGAPDSAREAECESKGCSPIDNTSDNRKSSTELYQVMYGVDIQVLPLGPIYWPELA